jgi:hypothetical protein
MFDIVSQFRLGLLACSTTLAVIADIARVECRRLYERGRERLSSNEEIDDFVRGEIVRVAHLVLQEEKRSLAERDFVEALKTRLTQLRC